MSARHQLALCGALAVLGAMSGCATSDRDRAVTRPALTQRALLPDYQRIELPSGAVLLLAVKDELPLVSLSARLRGGAVADPPGKAGLASLTAALLEKGAGARDARAMANAAADVGGQISAGAGLEYAAVSADFLAADAQRMIELVLDMLIRPVFDPIEFERVRERAIGSLQAARDGDPRSLMASYGSAFLFGDHPYGSAPSGTEATLATLTRDDVVAHHRAHYGPGRLILSIVGDIDPAAVRAEVARRLEGWRPAAAELPRYATPKRRPGGRVLLVDKPDATQSYFWMGNVGVAHNDPRRAPLDVANTLFGGRFTSMLNTALRVEAGLTYGASCRLMRHTVSGSVAITSYTATADTGEAMDLALEVLDNFLASTPDEATLESARTYLAGQYPLGFETAGQLAGRLAELAFLDQPDSAVNGYIAAVGAVDAAQYRATVSSVYPSRDDLVTVVVGNAAQIRDTVARYGSVTEVSIDTPSFRP